MDKAKPFDIPKREVWEAFKHVKANQGAAGVDGQSVAEFEADLSNNLYKLWNRLSSGATTGSEITGQDVVLWLQPGRQPLWAEVHAGEDPGVGRSTSHLAVAGRNRYRLNPLLQGWINYYGRYAPSALAPLLRCVNHTLLAWALRKFKRFRPLDCQQKSRGLSG